MTTIAVDFDGTIVEHKYPDIGKPVPLAVETLRALIENGHEVILYTMRSGDKLTEAIQYCTDNGIKLYAANNNPQQNTWTSSPKVYAQIYIDDAALGAPLIPTNDRPMVDWLTVRTMLHMQGLL